MTHAYAVPRAHFLQRRVIMFVIAVATSWVLFSVIRVVTATNVNPICHRAECFYDSSF